MYDQKIELNRQMNKTPESMAQALFKSWFVDFDPFIYNALAGGNPIPDVFAERAEQRCEIIENAKKPRKLGCRLRVLKTIMHCFLVSLNLQNLMVEYLKVGS